MRYRAATVRRVLEFRILGPLEVLADEGPVQLGGPRQRAALAILLLRANRVVSVDQLADDLYRGAAPVTAVTQVQRQVSELRKALGDASSIETRSPGYVLRLSPGQLDLDRFERLGEQAGNALARDDAACAADLLREALALWRGVPLADLAGEPFAQVAIGRLEEIRLAALEQRIEADLALGRHAELVWELEAILTEAPLRERFAAQLMLALYGSGRQADALEVYRRTRQALVDEVGIEPTPALHELERAILTHDPALADRSARPVAAAPPERAVLVVPSDEDRLDALLTVAEPLARLPGRELIIARLLGEEGELARAAAALNARRDTLGVSVRTAAFTTIEPPRDLARLAVTYDAELLLLDAPADLESDLPDDWGAILEVSPSDLALLVGRPVEWGNGLGLFVPFGGGEHDWAALELAASLASSTGAGLQLVGTRADPTRGRRDASRLLANASLAVQRVVHISAKPVLADPTEDALLSAVEDATLVVVGLSPRWRQEGLGSPRRALAHGSPSPTLLVHRGLQPGALAPRDSRTRFTWAVESPVGR